MDVFITKIGLYNKKIILAPRCICFLHPERTYFTIVVSILIKLRNFCRYRGSRKDAKNPSKKGKMERTYVPICNFWCTFFRNMHFFKWNESNILLSAIWKLGQRGRSILLFFQTTECLKSVR
jgi:hypothetical protein